MQPYRDFRSHIDLRFRPSLIVFVDEAGERICEQLRRIVQQARLDEILHQCIALLQVRTGEEDVVPVPVGEQFPEFDNNMPVEPGYLDDLIADALISIRLDRRLVEVKDAGYPVPVPLPQIYIVGDAHSQELKNVHESVQRLLMRRGLAALVCYVLDAYAGVNVEAHSVVDDPMGPKDTSYWLQREVPNFCFFYEGEYFHRRLHTVTLEESNYAAAEMLFALMATGITPEPSFEQFMRLPPNLSAYTNVGSIGTTLVIFPREEILEYCNARLGIALLRRWQSDIDSGILSEDRRIPIQRRADNDVVHLEQWIKDVRSRPGAGGDTFEAGARKPQNGDQNERQENTCPTLSILREPGGLLAQRAITQHQGLYRDVIDRTKALFELFHYGNIREEARRQRKRRDTWTRIVDQRAARAVGFFDEWDQTATQAWEAAGPRVCAEVRREVDLLWSSRENGTFGFEMAKTYADAYYDRFTKLADQLARLRELHLRDYQDSLDAFDALSQGEWLHTLNIVNGPPGAAPVGRATPLVAGVHAADAQGAGDSDPSGGVGGAEDAPTGASAPQHLTAREEQIALQLEARVLWLQDQVPSIRTQITVSLPFVLAAILTGLALYPRGNLYFVLGLVAGVIAGVCAVNWAFWKRYQKRVEEARMDLLRFYRRVYAFRCEQREDELRLFVTQPLRHRLLTMRQRLDTMSQFIGAMQYQLDIQSAQVRRDLFNSPSGVRNVYVANGERLQSSRRNTIEDFEALVTHQREAHPVQGCEWHQSLQAMKEQLIEMFRTLALEHSLIEMEEEEAREHIFAFASDINSAYLRGPLVDIRRALDKQEVWIEALERAQSPLYRAEVGIREPQMLFVCGQRSDLNEGQRFWPRGATPVLISDNHDWILIAALFRGGLPPVFDPDTLFPPKHNFSGGPNDGMGNGPRIPPSPPSAYPGDDDGDLPPVSPPAYPGDDEFIPTPAQPLYEDLVGGTASNTYVPPEDIWPSDENGSNPPLNPVTPFPGYAWSDGSGNGIPAAQDLTELAKRFERYERHLASYGMDVHPTVNIDNPDVDQPLRYRLAEIGNDRSALENFVNKNMADYYLYNSRFAQEPDNGLHAFYTAKSGFAVRYGQRALGLSEEQLLPWPECLQKLFGYVQNADLQRLVKEDATPARARVVNPNTPLPPGSMEPGENKQQDLTNIVRRINLPQRSQENTDAPQPGRFDSRKMRATRLNRIPDEMDMNDPDRP